MVYLHGKGSFEAVETYMIGIFTFKGRLKCRGTITHHDVVAFKQFLKQTLNWVHLKNQPLEEGEPLKQS